MRGKFVARKVCCWLASLLIVPPTPGSKKSDGQSNEFAWKSSTKFLYLMAQRAVTQATAADLRCK